MATPIFAPNNLAASALVTVAGSPVTISFNAAVPSDLNKIPDALLKIEIQSSGTTYAFVGWIAAGDGAKIIQGDGVYRISKPDTTVAYGADRS